MIRASIFALATLLASCGPSGEGAKTTSEPAAAPPAAERAEAPANPEWNMGDPCSAENYQDLIGQPRADAEAANTPHGTRIYSNDESVTMDHAPERLNVIIGEDGNVESLRCG